MVDENIADKRTKNYFMSEDRVVGFVRGTGMLWRGK